MEALSDRSVTYVEDEVIAEGGNEDDERFGYGYYRLASGWIAQGRADPASVETYKKKGCTPLIEQYGRFVMNPAIIRDKKGNTLPQWQPYFQPYDKLMLEDPGAFPVEQVVAYHWHRGVTANWIEYTSDGRYKTHRRKVHFPQLAGKIFPDHLCVICGRVLNTAAELNTHTRMAHPEQGTILKLAETQEAIATAITVAQGSGNGNDAMMTVLHSIVETQRQMGEVIMSLTQQPARATVRPGRPRGTSTQVRYHDEKGHFTPVPKETTDGTDRPASHERGGPDGGGDEAELRDPTGPVASA